MKYFAVPLMKPLLFFLFTFFLPVLANSQSCQTIVGQYPTTAFPVCGTSVFHQDYVADCNGSNIAQKGCSDPVTSSKSSWYKFTCFQAGTLGFKISGISSTDDYDWVLFDVTGRVLTDVYADASMVVSLNIYGTSGTNTSAPFPNSPTGCTPTGSGNNHCSGDASSNSPFNTMPTLVVGHDYLLMVTNWTAGSTVGYDLSFTGGTASITDPTNPSFQSARAICDGQTMAVKLNKKMKCTSLSANGSDFTVTPNRAPIVAAVGVGCSTGFDTDSIILSLASPLPAGSYIITAQNGSDANTMLDNCGRQIAIGDSKTVTVLPQTPTLMDSIIPIACAPTMLQLVFKKPMRCNTVAVDGSDFIITGPSNVTVSSAAGVCDSSGTGTVIKVFLSTPISVAGTYTITLKNGSDNNTIINECGQPTAAGSSLKFTGYDTVSANFTTSTGYSCLKDTITCFHDGRNGVTSWQWTFDNGMKSLLQNPPAQIYTTDGTKTITLAVTNGICTDTVIANIQITNNFTVKAGMTIPAFVCPNDTAIFKDSSMGKILNWYWDFGNGNTSMVQNPAAQYFQPTNISALLTTKLIVANATCADTIVKRYTLVNNCYVDVPTGFTPNGDGLNDGLYPLNAYKADDFTFRVYNRLGQLLYETKDWTRQWDGRYHGELQPTGAYVWMLQYTHHDTGKKYNLSGTSVLIR